MSKSMRVEDLPNNIGNVRILKLADGTIALSKKNKEIEKLLDENFDRNGKELRWAPRGTHNTELLELKTVFKNNLVYIVGKGPSLDNIIQDTFTYDMPIVAVNEAVHKVEEVVEFNPIFSIVQDGNLARTCIPKKTTTTVLIPDGMRHFYHDWGNKVVFSKSEFTHTRNTITAGIAIKIAKRLGAGRLAMVCFDACVLGNCAYAKCVGYSSLKGGNPSRFLNHKKKITQEAGDLSLDWIIPSILGQPCSYTPRQ